MRRALVLTVVVVSLLVSVTASATQSAGQAWNQFAAAYDFATYPQSGSTTFAQAYYGDNFNGDFAAILQRVEEAMGLRNPGIIGDDKLNTSLENWGSGIY